MAFGWTSKYGILFNCFWGAFIHFHCHLKIGNESSRQFSSLESLNLSWCLYFDICIESERWRNTNISKTFGFILWIFCYSLVCEFHFKKFDWQKIFISSLLFYLIIENDNDIQWCMWSDTNVLLLEFILKCRAWF